MYRTRRRRSGGRRTAKAPPTSPHARGDYKSDAGQATKYLEHSNSNISVIPQPPAQISTIENKNDRLHSHIKHKNHVHMQCSSQRVVGLDHMLLFVKNIATKWGLFNLKSS